MRDDILDQLRNAVEEAVDKLASRFVCSASIRLADSGASEKRLSFEKFDNKFDLFLLEGENRQALVHVSVRLRIAGLSALPQLIEALYATESMRNAEIHRVIQLVRDLDLSE